MAILGARRGEPPPALRRDVAAWLERFEAAKDRVGRDVRPGRSSVRGGSTWPVPRPRSMSGELQLFQLVFARPQLNNIPWTRAASVPVVEAST